jgi:hypothetical protein
MSAQHTPGPWEFAEWNAGINNRPGYGIMAEHGSLNVTVHTRKPKGDGFNDVDCTDQAKADAALIAAAPDLLEALEVMISDFGDYPASERPCRAFDLAYAAIKKAKREQP